MTCFKYGKPKHYKNVVKVWLSEKENNSSIGPRAKEKDIRHTLFGKNTSLDGDVTTLCLMAWQKRRDIEVSDSETYYLPSYNKLSWSLL